MGTSLTPIALKPRTPNLPIIMGIIIGILSTMKVTTVTTKMTKMKVFEKTFNLKRSNVTKIDSACYVSNRQFGSIRKRNKNQPILCNAYSDSMLEL
jgi:hypothetical protein